MTPFTAKDPGEGVPRFLDDPATERDKLSCSTLASSPDVRFLAMGGVRLHLWDLAGDKPRAWWSPADEANPIVRLAYAPDGKSLVARHFKGELRLWDVSDPKKPTRRLEMAVVKMEAKEAWPHAVLSADGKLLATAGGEEGHPPLGHGEGQADAARPAAGAGRLRALARLLARGPAATSRVGRTSGTWPASPSSAAPPASAATIPPSSRSAPRGGRRPRAATSIQVFHLLATTGGQLRKLPPAEGHRAGAPRVASAPDRRTLATSGDDGFMRLWRMTPFGPVERAVLRRHRDTVSALAFSPDSRTLLTTDWLGNAALWDLEGRDTAQRVPPRSLAETAWFLAGVHLSHTRDLVPRQRAGMGAAFLPDGKGVVLASGSDLRALDGKLVPRATLDGHKGTVCAVALSADGETLASVGNARERPDVATDRRFWLRGRGDETAIVWDAGKSPPARRAVFKGCGDALALSPDGKLLATGGTSPGEVLVRDAASGKMLHQWRFPDEVWSLAFAPDGRHLAAANIDGAIHSLRVKARK
ncbi:MAG: WD40 repeat domain-containing protein [Gemmataceae bacterium]|nr:WD40 repeat domain-containing protein [Gemmataceae bacterium]